jgi:hypothetical protein
MEVLCSKFIPIYQLQIHSQKIIVQAYKHQKIHTPGLRDKTFGCGNINILFIQWSHTSPLF